MWFNNFVGILLINHLLVTYSYNLICSDSSKKLEPSISDIFQTLLGNLTSQIDVNDYIPSDEKLSESIPEQLVHVLGDKFTSNVKNVANFEIPLIKLISNGLFTIDTNQISYNDVYLIQENHYLVNFICENLGKYSEYFSTSFCHCWSGEMLSGKTIGLSSKNNYYDTKFCSSRPCSEKTMSLGTCEIVVDPFRRSCVKITSLEEVNPLSVSYNLTIPTTESLGIFLKAMAQSFENNLKEFDSNLNTNSIVFDFIISMLHILRIFVDKIFTRVPFYIFNLILGSLLFINAETLANSKIFQYLLVASIGLAMAFGWILLTLYRSGSNTFKSVIPYAPSGLATMMLTGSLLVTNTRIRNSILTALWAFW